MTASLEELIGYRRKRAIETLEEAHIMADHAYYQGSANRMYYACFYAVNALFLKDGLSSSKHSGVRSLFNKHYIKTCLISEEAGVLYNTLYDIRQISDYEDLYVIDKEKVNSLLPRVETFLSEIEHQFIDKI